MKIVVLAGGISTERDVSIVSGLNVCKALRTKGHQAILLDVFFGREDADIEEAFGDEYDVEQEAAYIRGFNENLESAKKEKRDFFGPNVLALCKAADVVFLALHGENGENGKVQAAFDLFHIRYTGTDYLSSALAMNKARTKQIFRMEGIPTPGGTTIIKGQQIPAPEAFGMDFPLVVKTCCGGSSVGVYIVHNEKEYLAAAAEAFSYEDEVVVEEYISGREFSVAVVGQKAYPVIEIAPLQGFYDYKNKYQPGATIETCPAGITPDQTARMQRYAELGAAALGITSYCRLDFMMREDGEMYCLEANTLPGMTPTSLIPQEAQVLGMDYPTLCEELIRISMEKYNETGV